MQSPTDHPGVTGRAGNASTEPLAVSFKIARQIAGVGETTLWKWAKEKRIRLIRPPGTRRTLIDFRSLKGLLAPDHSDAPQPRRRGRPRKNPTAAVTP